MIQALILYFQFFSRIPIPIPVDEPVERMRKGVKYFTLFGLLVGTIELLVFAAMQLLLNPILAWVVTLFFDVLLTGGFHLDALSDMADGLFSSRNRERMLEIMKDSRVGSNGVLALIFYYLFLLVTFYSLVPFTDDLTRILIVLTFNLIGKTGISLLFFKMTYAGASPNGLGVSFLNVKTSDIFLAQLFTFLIMVLTFGSAGAIIYVGVFLFVWLYRWFVLKKVAGFNGDTLGACSPLCQILFLLILFGLRNLL